MNAETRALLTAALAQLPHRQRVVVELRDVHGLPADEVCSILAPDPGEPAGAAAPRPREAPRTPRGPTTRASATGGAAMTADYLPCVHVVELLTDYLDGALDPGHHRPGDAHLADCEPCTTYLAQLRTTITDLGTLPAPTLPADAVTALEAAFRDLHHPTATDRQARRVTVIALSVATAHWIVSQLVVQHPRPTTPRRVPPQTRTASDHSPLRVDHRPGTCGRPPLRGGPRRLTGDAGQRSMPGPTGSFRGEPGCRRPHRRPGRCRARRPAPSTVPQVHQRHLLARPWRTPPSIRNAVVGFVDLIHRDISAATDDCCPWPIPSCGGSGKAWRLRPTWRAGATSRLTVLHHIPPSNALTRRRNTGWRRRCSTRRPVRSPATGCSR